jgi:hypothetical protein
LPVLLLLLLLSWMGCHEAADVIRSPAGGTFFHSRSVFVRGASVGLALPQGSGSACSAASNGADCSFDLL